MTETPDRSTKLALIFVAVIEFLGIATAVTAWALR
jgi:hypothetical protein